MAIFKRLTEEQIKQNYDHCVLFRVSKRCQSVLLHYLSADVRAMNAWFEEGELSTVELKLDN